MQFLENIEQWLLSAPANQLIGYLYMLGIICFMMFLAIKYRHEFWLALHGVDGKLQPMEIAVMIWVIVFPNAVLADIFLGVKASDAVWWSLDALMFFIITGKAVTNFRGGAAAGGSEIVEEVQETLEKTVAKTDKAVKTTTTTKTEKKEEGSEEDPKI